MTYVEAIDALESMFNKVINFHKNNPPSAGEGSFVLLKPELQQKYQTGSMMRMTIEGSKIEFHAGPAERNYDYVQYKLDPRNFISYADDYADGKNPIVPVEKMMTRPHKPIADERNWTYLDNLEKELFLYLSNTYRNFALLNPSWGTFMRASKYVCNVCLTSDFPHQEEILAYMDKIKDEGDDRVHLCSMGALSDLVVYMGSNRPEVIPDYIDRYVVAIPDPFQVGKVFDDYFVENGNGYRLIKYLKVTKKSVKYQQLSYLYDTPPNPLYSPPMLSEWCKCSIPFFLESTETFPFVRGRDTVMPIGPVYLPSLPDLTVLGDKEVRLDGNVVYDVVIPGTYLSRRRWDPPDGYVWVDLCKNGEVPITPYTVKLRRDLSISTELVSHRGRDITVQVYSQFPVRFIDDAEKFDLPFKERKKWKKAAFQCRDHPAIAMGWSPDPVPGPFNFKALSGYCSFGTLKSLRDSGFKRISCTFYYSEKWKLFYFLESFFDTGFFFIDDPDGTYVTNFAPKGIVYNSKVQKDGIVTYVHIDNHHRIARNFFPTVSDFIRKYGTSPTSMTMWTGGDYFRPLDTAARYQARNAISSKHRVTTLLSTVKVVSWMCPGLTVPQIVSRCTTEESTEIIKSILLAESCFLKLRGKQFVKTQWILKSNLNIKMREGNTSLGGQVLSDIVRLIDENRVSTWTFDVRSPEHSMFIRLLADNMYRVYVNLRVHPAEFKVKKL
jgi:hypothetical protein